MESFSGKSVSVNEDATEKVPLSAKKRIRIALETFC